MKALAIFLLSSLFFGHLNLLQMKQRELFLAKQQQYQEDTALYEETLAQYQELYALYQELPAEDPDRPSLKAALLKTKAGLKAFKPQLKMDKANLEQLFSALKEEDIPKTDFLLEFALNARKVALKARKLQGNIQKDEWRETLHLDELYIKFKEGKKLKVCRLIAADIKALVEQADNKPPTVFLEELAQIFERYDAVEKIKKYRAKSGFIESSIAPYVLSPNQLEPILDQALAKDDFLTEEELEEKKNIVLKIQEEKNSINRWKDEEYLTWDDSINLADCLAPSYFPQVVANDYYTDKYVKVATVKNSLLQSLERLEQEGSLEEHKVFIHCDFDFSNYRVQSLREIFNAVGTERLVQLRSQLAYLEKNPNVKVDSQQLKSLLNGMSADPNDFIGQIMLLDISKLKAVTLSQIYTALGDAITNYSALEGLITNEFPKRSIQNWTSFDAKFASVIVLATVKPSPLQKIIQAWSEEYRDLFSNKLAKYKYRYFSRKTLERNAQNNLKISDFPELETLFQQTFKETLVEGEKLSYSEVASSWQAFLLELAIHKGINHLEQHQAAVQALEKAGIHALADSTKLEAIFQPIPLPKKEAETLFDLGKNSFKIQWIFNWKKAVADIVLLAEQAEEVFNTIEDNVTDIIAEGVKRITDWILQFVPDMPSWWSDDDAKKARKTTTDRKSVIRLLKAKLIEALKSVAAKEQESDIMEYTFSLSRKITEGGSFSYAITNNSNPVVTKGGNNYMTIKASDLFAEYSKSEKNLKIKFLLRVEKNSFQTTKDLSMSAFTVITAGTSGGQQVSNAYTEQQIEITAKIKESTKEEITVEVNTSKDNFNCVNMAEVAFATSVDVTPPSQTKTIKLTPVAK
ncbi:hypothetical protein SapgrDRAFT_2104 [Saprospira grandis DSM 2844]|uniref:Uncharacterized protein n=1 Tax=Saprospira grandis DSM 2844 TaxID=694433 RepID=J0P1Y3_9BACT|nr:hypothetical protein [Saprospira grandis]EJF53789.1 hypothetical protein SapgrDRAFT_2104 [Saprospira grandis DSM 2844]